MQDICKSIEDLFPEALAQAAHEAAENLAAFAELLQENPASASSILRGYLGAGQPYGPGASGAARWYAERAVSLCLTSFSERHIRHHSNMAVTQRILTDLA